MTANDYQVGGAHYVSAYQHWDFVLDVELDYLRACALKYLSRAHLKNGEQDMDKAAHFMEKCSEDLDNMDNVEQQHERLCRVWLVLNVPPALHPVCALLLQGRPGAAGAALATLRAGGYTPTQATPSAPPAGV